MSCIANDKELSDLLNQINELRTLGVTGPVEPPQLIVFGRQSPSKATILERISGLGLPEASGFAIKLTLRKSPTRTVEASIVPGPSRNAEETQRLRAFTPEKFDTIDGLPELIRQVAGRMVIDNRVSDDLLKLEVSGPEQVELAVVDLPCPCDSSEAKDHRAVTDLIEKYVEDRRSIIITVIDATSALIDHSRLRLVEKFDLQWERVFFITTGPGLLSPDREEEKAYMQFLKDTWASRSSEGSALRHGYQSSQAQQLSDESCDKKEKALFRQERWAFLPREHMGKDNIARRLNAFILQHVHKNIPSLINGTNEEIHNLNGKLSKLGLPRSMIQQQKGYLLSISSGFERIVNQALTGMYSDDFFRAANEPAKLYGFPRLRAVVWELNEYFADAMLTRGSRRRIIETKPALGVQNDAKNSYPKSPVPVDILRSDLKTEFIIGELFQDHAQPWEELAKTHALRVWEAVRYFVSLALQHLADSHTYASILRTIVAPELATLKQKLLEKLDELTAHLSRSPPLPLGKALLIKTQQARSDRVCASVMASLATTNDHATASTYGYSTESIKRAVSTLEASRDDPDFVAAGIIDQMEAYYDTTLMIFINNVAVLGIENCLLEPLKQILTCQTINNMEDDQVQCIAAEPAHLTGERQRLSKDIEKLQAGLQVLSLSKPMEPSWANAPALETNQCPSRNATKMLEKPERVTTVPASKSQGTLNNKTLSPTIPPPSKTSVASHEALKATAASKSRFTDPLKPLFGAPVKPLIAAGTGLSRFGTSSEPIYDTGNSALNTGSRPASPQHSIFGYSPQAASDTGISALYIANRSAAPGSPLFGPSSVTASDTSNSRLYIGNRPASPHYSIFGHSSEAASDSSRLSLFG
ncbi:P-loop containing nucleoside triphosphate hydrolase protein [Aspergillus pseudodeflectus]|uniref:P-loop containing nucleoside triphosphate hydrolase protein n=1 Tax=Aspergillus pseudodeflectus TaxID=176178 RepID=A0ABR4KK95_9EURO